MDADEGRDDGYYYIVTERNKRLKNSEEMSRDQDVRDAEKWKAPDVPGEETQG